MARSARSASSCAAPASPAAKAALFPDWRYHAFITDRDASAVELDADHRRHAVVELVIRDWKHGSGAHHCPSGPFSANAAWAVHAALAHNPVRWVAVLGVGIDGPVVAKRSADDSSPSPDASPDDHDADDSISHGTGPGKPNSSSPPPDYAPSPPSADQRASAARA